MAEWARRADAHAPVRQGHCEACHDPHGGGTHLITQATEPLCLKCHGEKRSGWRKDSHVHQPQPRGDCLKCHAPHLSDQPRLVAVPAGQLCAG